jgi:hypothetical protein
MRSTSFEERQRGCLEAKSPITYRKKVRLQKLKDRYRMLDTRCWIRQTQAEVMRTRNLKAV